MSISFAEFQTKGEDLLARMSVIKELFNEANELVKSFDPDEVFDEDSEEDEDNRDKAYEIAHDIAYEGKYIFDSFDEISAIVSDTPRLVPIACAIS